MFSLSRHQSCKKASTVAGRTFLEALSSLGTFRMAAQKVSHRPTTLPSLSLKYANAPIPGISVLG
jgi:hypothetical protein